MRGKSQNRTQCCLYISVESLSLVGSPDFSDADCGCLWHIQLRICCGYKQIYQYHGGYNPPRDPRDDIPKDSLHCVMSLIFKMFHTSSTAQGGGGSFKNRKPIGEIDCCESRMAERIHWLTERWLELCLLEWLQWLQWSPHPQLLDVVWCTATVVVVVA